MCIKNVQNKTKWTKLFVHFDKTLFPNMKKVVLKLEFVTIRQLTTSYIRIESNIKDQIQFVDPKNPECRKFKMHAK